MVTRGHRAPSQPSASQFERAKASTMMWSLSPKVRFSTRRGGSGRVGSGLGRGWVGVGLGWVGSGSGRVGSGRVGVGSGRGWVGSGRVGLGRVGSGRVGSGRVGSGTLRRGSPTTCDQLVSHDQCDAHERALEEPLREKIDHQLCLGGEARPQPNCTNHPKAVPDQ